MGGFVNIHGQPLEVAQQAPAGTPKAYPAPPGSGPPGMRCKHCKNKETIRNYSGSKTWVKCLLRFDDWTRGPGTDIRANTPACRKFQPKE